MPEHTRRPWKREGRTILGRAFDGSWREIVSVVRGGNLKEAKANAHLIAAAPQLYEALSCIENDNNSIPARIWTMRNAALDAAKGEGR